MKTPNISDLEAGTYIPDIKNSRFDRSLLTGISALALAFLIFTFLSIFIAPTDDVVLYHQYARRILNGEIPYRDFFIEYPPFSLPFFVLPAIINLKFLPISDSNYTLIFQAQCFFLAGGLLVVVWELLRTIYPRIRLNRQMFYITFATILMALYVLRRFDIGATFLLALSFYLLYIRKPVWGGLVLGLSTAAKLFPGIILPLAVIYFWRHKGNRKFALQLFAGFCIGCGIVTIPFIISSLPGMLNFLRYHSERGIEIESVFASVMRVASFFGAGSVGTSSDHGSLNLVSSWGPALANLSSVLTVSGLLVFYGCFWWASQPGQRQTRPDWLIQASALAILWFIICNKVLSPYYLIWLLPFSAFWRGNKIVVYLAAVTLTVILIPLTLLGVHDPDWLPMLIALVRNCLLVALLIMQIREVFSDAGKKGEARLNTLPAEVK